MAKHSSRRRRGQALVMVTLALFMIGGMIGLVVDLGWAYYVKKSAQTAADAAAIAAVKMAMDDVAASGLGPNYRCEGGEVTCSSTPDPCPSVGNLQSACIYAAQNGFSNDDRRISVTVQASDDITPPTVTGCTPEVKHPPTAPCVDTPYWVTVRITQRIPQLFSALLGHWEATAGARATAAVARSQVQGSLILLNRQHDPWVDAETGKDATGTNLRLGGGPEVTVPGGILLASNAGGGADRIYAGEVSGGGTVRSPFTYIRTGGANNCPTGNCSGGSGTWTEPYKPRDDGDYFYDPMRTKKGQPPLTSSSLTARPVLGGVLNDTICPGYVCASGNYYAAQWVSDGAGGSKLVATGQQMQLPNRTAFTFQDGPFGDFNFFGGLKVDQATVNFGPGRYVMAGVLDPSTEVLQLENKAMVLSTRSDDAGRIFILTNTNYLGLQRQLDTIANNQQLTSLSFGRTSIKSGNTEDSRVELFGLNPKGDGLPSELNNFTPVLIWQDQQNSNVKYTADGQIDITSCGPDHDLDNPCMNTPSNSPQLQLNAAPFAKYGGVIYQPRGAWTWLQASETYTGALQVISGAMKIQGTGRLALSSPTTPVTTWIDALVE